MVVIVKVIVMALIKMYRLYISPMKPPTCRFVPTCSEYALLAIEKYGLFVGIMMAMRRILRCHPFSSGGYDPV